MAFFIPVIMNVEDLDSFFTSDTAISLILNIVTKLSESCSAFYLYSCKDLSVINLSEAKLYNGIACGRCLSLLVYFRVFLSQKGFSEFFGFFVCNRGSLIISLNYIDIIDRGLRFFYPSKLMHF